MEPVLNERSLEPAPVPTLDRAQSLVAVLGRLDKLGFPRVLRHARDAIDLNVEEARTLKEWLFREAPREMRQFLGGRLSKAPFVEELHAHREDETGLLLEALYGGERALGAGIAYLRDAPAVALRGVPRWEVDPLVLTLTRMNADAVEELRVEVIHLCRPEQIDAREKALRERVLSAVDGGDDLLSRRLSLYPRLTFCDGAQRQLRGLSGREIFFQHVVLALSRLDAALGTWAASALEPGMDSSHESKQTLAHSSYGPMRDFSCPDGRTRRFSNHLKLFSCNWRIYYFETRSDEAGGHALVGYVGTHLPTVKYRT
jgi:hypothetical protein